MAVAGETGFSLALEKEQLLRTCKVEHLQMGRLQDANYASKVADRQMAVSGDRPSTSSRTRPAASGRLPRFDLRSSNARVQRAPAVTAAPSKVGKLIRRQPLAGTMVGAIRPVSGPTFWPAVGGQAGSKRGSRNWSGFRRGSRN